MLDKNFLVSVGHFISIAVTLKGLSYILPISITSYYTFVANILLFAILSWHSFTFAKKYFLKDRVDLQNKAVLITGCDSGFGHNLAKRLDSKGWNVFATCLFPFGHGANELRKHCTSRLQILELDVTKEESVENAVTFVEQNLGSAELWSVVNNAGIAKGLSLDVTSVQDYKDCMEVNVYGMIRVTKAFLPLIKKTKGRFVNITSIAGRVTIPHVSPYMMSKHAAVGLSDSLRQELVDWGIRVISIEPEIFQTGLLSVENTGNISQTVFNRLNETQNSEYDEEYQNNFIKSQNIFISLASSNIQVVVDDLESAISLEYPDSVYSPRRNLIIRLLLYAFLIFPIPIRDLIVQIALFCFRYKKPKIGLKTS